MKSLITKNSFSFVYIILLTVLLIGCNKNGSASMDHPSDEGNNEGEFQEEPFEISILLNLHNLDVPNDRIKDLIEEATNTILNIQFVPEANYNDRINTAFATGNLPMVVPMSFQMFTQYKDAIRADQFWEIGPYLHEYENLNKLKPEIVANTKLDGKIYSLYQGRPLSRQGIIYRKDWAENLGLSAPTTTEELFEMARAFTEDDPNRTGQNDTIGITDRSDLVYGAFKTIASWFGVPNEYGIMDDQIIPEFMFPEYLDTLTYFRELYENGYMNQDFPVTSKREQQEMLINGTAGIYIGSMPDVVNLYNEAAAVNPDVVFDVHNRVKGPNGEFNVWAIPGFSNVFLFPKASVRTEEDLRKILTFFDQLMTAELSNIMLWGIEGEHYEVVEGMAKIINSNLHDTEVRPYLSLEVGERETNGGYERYFSYEVQVKAIELINDNENYLIHNPAFTLTSNTFVLNGNRFQQIIEDATLNFILGQIDETDFQEAIQDWLDSGGYKIIEEFTASFTERNE